MSPVPITEIQLGCQPACIRSCPARRYLSRTTESTLLLTQSPRPHTCWWPASSACSVARTRGHWGRLKAGRSGQLEGGRETVQRGEEAEEHLGFAVSSRHTKTEFGRRRALERVAVPAVVPCFLPSATPQSWPPCSPASAPPSPDA